MLVVEADCPKPCLFYFCIEMGFGDEKTVPKGRLEGSVASMPAFQRDVKGVSRVDFSLDFRYKFAMPLKGTIVGITDASASILMENGQKMQVPLTSIEGLAKEGQEVAVVLTALGSEDAGRQKLARELLNALLMP
jgi:hypothetical protein